MKTPISIRLARPDLADAGLLRAIERDTLGDSDFDAREVLAVLRQPEHVAFLACATQSSHAAADVVGFCSCFLTALDGCEMCLEVDMLGVHTAWRRQGIASALIRTACQWAITRGVSQMRAVVAEDNHASQGAFSRAGFVRTRPLRRMLVHELDDLDQARDQEKLAKVTGGGLARCQGLAAIRGERHEMLTPAGHAVCRCLSVATLAYRGLWIEAMVSDNDTLLQPMSRWLAGQAQDRGLDEVGFLAPIDQPALSDSLTGAGYLEIDSYWVYRRDTSLAQQ